MSAETLRHPFSPRHDGRGCRHLTYVDHRPVECGESPTCSVHTGTRSDPPELEFPPPPCSLCGEDTYHDGDGFRCDACEASWDNSGRGGTWDEPSLKVCPATRKPFDHAGLDPRHESIRHHVAHCNLPLDHAGKHRSDEWTLWEADQ